MSLVLFTDDDLAAGKATAEVWLDPASGHRTGDVWHVLLPGLDPTMLYGYRAWGPNQDAWEAAASRPQTPEASVSSSGEEEDERSAFAGTPPPPDPHQAGRRKNPEAGHRFDPSRVLLDPYARGVLSARRRYAELGPPDLPYGSPGALGLAATWPQAAGTLPAPPANSSSASAPSLVPPFDWQGDIGPLQLPPEDLVVYEMHVRGFTAHPSSGVRAPGTFLGLVERLDYLERLGVTCLELLPIHEFNELEYDAPIPGSLTGERRRNFWGYSTVGFFAPMARYSYAASLGAPGAAVADEFKLLVRECHKRGIEVILDVVFNHTAEGDERGPTLSFRGLDNRVYYMLAPRGEYYNYSGCGNTLNCGHPVVRKFIVDCLRHWVEEYHVDGFRFDLASILTRAHSAWHPTVADDGGGASASSSASPVPPPLTPSPPGSPFLSPSSTRSFSEDDLSDVDDPSLPPRGPIVDPERGGIMTDGAGVPTGTPLSRPPLIEAISEDPVLRGVRLIAEAWDCDGLNQVGAFPHYGNRWSEWNGHYRDAVRQFLKGTETGGWAGAFASAVLGSPNLYASTEPGEHEWWATHGGGREWRGNRYPLASVNFVAAHDGFTLADLVAFNEKHNEANGEGNADGESHNLTWNCGAEGATEDKSVNALRRRQMRNFALALLLSHGVPMLQMGDEMGHSKRGNNNTYCHDSELNFLDWTQASEDDQGFARFVRRLIHFRRARPELRRAHFVGGDRDVQWHGEKAFEPDWSDGSRLVAYTLSPQPQGLYENRRPGGEGGLYIAFNTAHYPRVLELPRWEGREWVPVFDSGRVAPYDCLVADDELEPEEVAAARVAGAMFSQAHAWPVLPWSCVVLESVPEGTVAGATRARARPDTSTSEEEEEEEAEAQGGKKKKGEGEAPR
jgi:isoamylase